MNTIKFDKKDVKMVAHRGVSGLEKENTLPAFVAAGSRSHFGVETDVHRTADGKFVIIHDDNTGRVGTISLPVEETPFQRLRDLYLTDIDGTVGRCDLHIPTLEEAMEFIDDDELIEITPKSIRMRKRILDTETRKKIESRKKA